MDYNFFAATALLVSVMIFGMNDWKARDEKGRGFLGRLENWELNKGDITFLKLEAIALGSAVVSLLIWGP